MRMIIVLVRFSMLEVQNLSVNYRIIRALEDVSLTLWLHIIWVEPCDHGIPLV
jgi:hypothetical protein